MFFLVRAVHHGSLAAADQLAVLEREVGTAKVRRPRNTDRSTFGPYGRDPFQFALQDSLVRLEVAWTDRARECSPAMALVSAAWVAHFCKKRAFR